MNNLLVAALQAKVNPAAVSWILFSLCHPLFIVHYFFVKSQDAENDRKT